MYPGIHALTTPDKPALIMAATGRQVTYAALEDRSLRIANWLRSQGFKRGDVIALLADNDARTFDVYWAAQRCGLYLTAINVHLKRDEVRYILENSGARALFLGNTGAELVGAWDALPHLVHRVSFEEGVTDFLPLEALIASASSVRPAHEPRGGDMLYSSGTTGRPKGVCPSLPDRDISQPGDTVVAMFGGHFGLNNETVYLSPAPLYHAAPLRTCAAVQALGGTAIVMEKFDAETSLALIDRYRVNASQWVPTMFVRMLKLPEEIRAKYDVRSLQVAIHAAAPAQ